MMQTLDLGRFRKARLWLDEFPDLPSIPGRVTERSVRAGDGRAERTQAAVELFVPMDPHVMYGLSGATLTSGPLGRLLIRVFLTSDSDQPFAESLAAGVDQPRVGLAEEYAGAVLDGILGTPAVAEIGSCVLVVDHAVHGLVGSSSWLFRRLGQAVAMALTADGQTSWNTALAGLLD